MGKSFNPKQRLLCSLCGWYYTKVEGHDPNDCAGRIKQLQIDLGGKMRDLEEKYKVANKRAQAIAKVERKE